MLQNIVFEGRLVKEPEIMNGEFGDYCFMSVASDRPYKDKTGQWQDNATFVPCKFTGEFVIQKLQQCKKGYKLLLEGVFDSYQGKDDKYKQLTIKINKIHAYTPCQIADAAQEVHDKKQAIADRIAANNGEEAVSILEDEVPF